MSDATKTFSINTYSYTLSHSAADCLRHLADQGYEAFELMMYPGHLWPTEVGESGRRELRKIIDEHGLRIVSLNMPNIDLNVTGASQEMRDYSLGLLTQFVALAGDLGTAGIVIGPGKGNPLFPPPRELLIGHFYRALDRLYPIAEKGGTKLLVENMPFGFLPDADGIMKALDNYGNDDIFVIYDVANGHFINQSPAEELRRVAARLKLVHFSDTGRKVYRHDAVGLGDVPFAEVPEALRAIGYAEKPMLEIISQTPDEDILKSAEQLYAMGYR